MSDQNTKIPPEDRGKQQRFEAALVEYLDAEEQGRPVDREAFIAEHSEFRLELEEFFASQEVLRRAGINHETEKTQTFARSDVSSSESTDEVPRNQNVRYFGNYELIEEIARGGMGVVYKARQTSLKRTVAVKMILSGQLASDDDIARFYIEAEAAAKL